jgi:hypothetical protein
VAALRRLLTTAQFADLAGIRPGLEWPANVTNPKARAPTIWKSRSFIA